MLNKYMAFRKTRNGMILGVALALILVYIFGSLAIDTGSLWIYAITFLFVFEAVSSLVNIFTVQDKGENAKKRGTSKKTT